jgi:hypothetical protein
MKLKIIAVDFDGTLCTDEWPDIGKPIHRVLNYGHAVPEPILMRLFGGASAWALYLTR